jgi:hypothetical protein
VGDRPSAGKAAAREPGGMPANGYFERMARTKVPDKARVPIGLKVSEADATQIDQVLLRPEFAGWTRAEWCREIIRTALRYYAGDPPPPDPGRARAAAQPAAAQPAAAQPVPPSPPPPAAAGPAAPAARRSDAAGESAAVADGPGPDGLGPLESPAQADCPHPADARDYERGACGACGAILWD